MRPLDGRTADGRAKAAVRQTSGERPGPRGGRADPDAAAPDPTSDAGDPVCWLALVCDACGALADRPHGPVCERCGSPRDEGQVG